MSLLKLETQTRKVVNEINAELTKVEKQRERLVTNPNLLKNLYRFSIECLADPEKAKKELEGYKPSAKRKNPYHAPVKYLLQDTKFCPADITHFGVIFNDAHHRGVAVHDITKELKRFGNKRDWYDEVNEEVRQRVLGMKVHATENIRKRKAKGGLVDIRHGDALRILQTIPDSAVDAVVTDPPYGIGINNADDWDSPENAKVLWESIYAECYRVLKQGGFLIAFGSTRTYHRMVSVLETTGFKIKDMICRWNFQAAWNDEFALQCVNEPIVIAVKGVGRLYASTNKLNGKRPKNVVGVLPEGYEAIQKSIIIPRCSPWERHMGFDLKPENDRSLGELFNKGKHPISIFDDDEWIDVNGDPKWNGHKCVKPMKLMEWLINLSTKPGETVLDPFMGSGSTGLGCLLTGRNFIGLELDERYFKVAEIRLKFFMDQINDKKPIAHLGRWLKDASELVKEPANQSKDKAAA